MTGEPCEGWTHAMCADCWTQRNPSREPHRMRHADLEQCCYCGRSTGDGIYVRDDPSEVHK